MVLLLFTAFNGELAPFVFYHIRGKDGKNQSYVIFRFCRGTNFFFSPTISVVNTVKIEIVILFTVFTGGSPHFYHIRGKPGKTRVFIFFVFLFIFTVFNGESPLLSSTISAENTVNIETFLFFCFDRGGAPFFNTISAVKTANITFCYCFSCTGAKGYPLAKQRTRTGLARRVVTCRTHVPTKEPQVSQRTLD